MRPEESIEKSIRDLHFKARAEMHNRTLGDVLEVHEQSKKAKSAEIQPNLWRTIMKSRITKCAVAAAVIIALLIGAKMLSGSYDKPDTKIVVSHPVPPEKGVIEKDDSPLDLKPDLAVVQRKLDLELQSVDQMFAANDVGGLTAMLSQGQFKTQLAAANYLAKMEDGVQALEVLKKVYVEYGEDAPDNPFAPAVEKIEKRIETKKRIGKTAAFVSQGSETTGDGQGTGEAVSLATAAGPQLTEGVRGQAYYFDGDTDYINFGNDSSLNLEHGGWGAWVNLDSKTHKEHGRVIFKENSRGIGIYELFYTTQGDRFEAEVVVAGERYKALSPSGVNREQWYHLFATYDGQTLKLYVDGQEAGAVSDPNGSIDDNTGPLGVAASPSGPTAHEFYGTIDEVVIYNRVLSDDEIQWLYQNPGRLTGGETGLVGYWNFDADQHGIVKDSSPYGNDGELCSAAAAGLTGESPESPLPECDAEFNAEGRRKILFGAVVDERGYPVPDARVFGSFAHHGRTDANGTFDLVISPADRGNSMGSVDFPMFIWAYGDNDPHRMAWTVIRHPNSDRENTEIERLLGGAQLIEETHQGVKLIVEDEDDFAQSLPGDPGQVCENPDGGPVVRDIVLVMAPAGAITGRVTDASGSPLPNATVSVDEIQVQLGDSSLTISNLDHDWKAEAFAVTDNWGSYQLSNLPAAWTSIQLKADADGYATGQQEFENAGQNILQGCDFQLTEGQPEDDSEIELKSGVGGFVVSIGDRTSSPEDDEDEHFEDVQAGGQPVKAGGNSTADIVPAGLHQNLVLYYSFYNSADPNTVTDISGGNFHGQVHGAEYTTDDILGGAMAFDGQDDCISTPDVYFHQFTFSAWVKTEATGGDLNNRRIFLLTGVTKSNALQGNSLHGKNCYALQGNSNSLSVYVADGVEVNEYNWSFAKNVWTHLTLTHDGQTFRIYKNGRLTEAGNIETSGVTGTLYIGGTDQHRGGFWQGTIDELAIFDRALTDDEVGQLFSMTGIAVETDTEPAPQGNTSEDDTNDNNIGATSLIAVFSAAKSSRERKKILFGAVLDERGVPLPDARVFGSFALHGATDPNGNFALLISPTDGTNSMGPADFPMFVWAYQDNDPYRMAWTLIRHPASAGEEVEETHQGVELIIADENDLAQNIPGDPGELFGDLRDDPRVRDIVLVMGPARVLTGRVTDASGSPIPNATVRIEELEIQLGANKLVISNLDHDWKAEAFAVTDNLGNYQLSNLPAAWTSIQLKANADGYATGRQEFQNDGRTSLPGCDFQLTEAQPGDNIKTTSGESEDTLRARGMYGGYRRAKD